MQPKNASVKRSAPIRTVLVDGNQECLTRLGKWMRTLPDLELVGTACSGIEALEQCRLFRPDLVIMDVTLPIMSGYEATVRIKKSGQCTTVILMSFFHLDESYGKDDYSKADALLNKDAVYEDLIPTVTRLFSETVGVQGQAININMM